MTKYHVALSFAGEDRDYVEQVADSLRAQGIRVFYDRFEETTLWGKDLYEHLSDVYRNMAYYTVIFVSSAYKEKLWTNHERKSAQSRALAESREYILPAKFDTDVEVPGLLPTIGYVNLAGVTPVAFAMKIVQKLREANVSIHDAAVYSKEAKADVDFPISGKSPYDSIIRELKSHNYYTQNPAMERIHSLDWEGLTPDQLFVLGRNVYQTACGGERRATSMVRHIRSELARFPADVSMHLLNGMLYEAYFDSRGVFRGTQLKSALLRDLLEVQDTDKYKRSVSFIRDSLEPYRDHLAIVPRVPPEEFDLRLEVQSTDPPTVTSISWRGKELLVADTDQFLDAIWRAGARSFTLHALKKLISDTWHVPLAQIKLTPDVDMADSVQFRLPEDKILGHPRVH